MIERVGHSNEETSRVEVEEKKKRERKLISDCLQLISHRIKRRQIMEQSSYWNTNEQHHPRNRLLKYSKSSKISRGTLTKLRHLRKIYQKLPAIIYSYQDPITENQGKKKQETSNYSIFLC